MYQLKQLHAAAIPRALLRADHYRLLNEPWQAESICRDILRAEPDNQAALVTLLLALTDQFGPPQRSGPTEARTIVARLTGDYERAYYGGLISERWAKTGLADRLPGHVIHDWFMDALQHYELAERLSPPGTEDAILRWNACVRLLDANPHLVAHDDEHSEAGFADTVPTR